MLKTVFQEQISERICKQIVEQAAEAPKTSSRDRTLQRAAEQIPNVPVPEMVTQLMEVPETVSQDRITQRTVEQIVDAPVPQAVQELADVFRVFSQDRIQQRIVEQTIPATSLAEMIIEVPVIQTPERTQQVVNTSVQHIVDTVEVEKPKIIDETVQKPTIQEKINQVTKHVEVPLVQFLDKVVAQRQIPIVVQTIQKTTDIPQLQCIDKVIDVPVVSVAQAPHVQIVEKTVESAQMQIAEKTAEIPLLQIVKKTVETPEVQTVRCAQTSESLGTAPFCQAAQAETVEAVEIKQRQNHMVQTVQMPMETPQWQIVDVPGVVQQTVKELRSKFEVGHKKEARAQDRLNKDAQERADLMNQRHVFAIQNAHKTVEVPRVQYIDKVADIQLDVQRQVSTIQAAQDIDEVENVTALTQSEVPNIPDGGEDWLEQENKRRRLPTPAEAVSESHADESDFDRFEDLVLPSPEGKTLFVSIASGDEAEDESDKEQEMTQSLVQGGESVLVDETEAQGPEHKMIQVVRTEWAQELREVRKKSTDDVASEMTDVKN